MQQPKSINYSVLLKSFTSELKLELSMRRKVWRVIPGTQHKFSNQEKQSRYNDMRLMQKVFEEMNTKELLTIIQRIERKRIEAENPSQKKLF